jgi:hypothetical protein
MQDAEGGVVGSGGDDQAFYLDRTHELIAKRKFDASSEQCGVAI